MFSASLRRIVFVGLACLVPIAHLGCVPVPEEVSYEGCAGDGEVPFPEFTAGPFIVPFPQVAGAPLSVAYDACTLHPDNGFFPAITVFPAFTDRIEILQAGMVVATHDIRSTEGQVPGEDQGEGCYGIVEEFTDGLEAGTYTLRIHLDAFDEAVICEIEEDVIAELEFTVIEPEPGDGGPGDSPDDTEAPPDANAGPDQIVRPLEIVSMDASASDDPDGGTLTFSWTQLDGVPIGLIDEDTATPSFGAPLDTGLIRLEVTVSDDEGETDTDIVEIDVDQGATLFVANTLGNSVLGFDAGKPPLLDGDVAPDAILAGDETAIDGPLGVFFDGAAALLVLSENGSQGLATAAAFSVGGGLPGLDGAVPPERLADLDPLASGDPSFWVGDAGLDMLFITDDSTQSIRVYEGTSTAAFDGMVSPARELSGSFVAGARGMHLDAAMNLYVTNGSFNNVMVFAGAQALNGFQVPARTLTSNAFTKPVEVFIDADDTLYVVNGPGEVLIFEAASFLNGAVAPNRIVAIDGAMDLTDIAIDSFGHAYVLDQGASAIYGFDGFAVLNGSVSPDRVIQGPETGLDGPFSLHLVE